MYFKKLELVGFKSFCEKTTFRFERGITAIVGPNGTGKSNVFDGIRWVLGEQSAKSLRGSEMQDVIFNGTDIKEPLSMAEVTLTFDNESRFFKVDQPEVAVTRRIFRSGESEYLLNKTPVRLKDILDILLGTGIGAESYSIIAQGKIDLVLSSKPEERRLVFDEASGITKYKAQKRESLRKLEETEQNLLRVNDIITEVKRQIGSLERQANKARRYKEVFEELKQKEINLSIFQKKCLLKEKDEIIDQLKQLEEQESGLLELVLEQESGIANRRQELKNLEDNMMALKNQILNLENLLIRNNEHIKFNQDRIIELQSNEAHLEKQLEQVKFRLVLDEEKLNSVKQEFAGISKNIEEKTGLLLEKETQIDDFAISIKNSLDNITRTKKEIFELVAKITSARNEVTDFNSKEHFFLQRKKRLEIEKAKVYEEKAITQTSLDNAKQELELLRKTIDELNIKISNTKAALGQERLALDNINPDINNLEKEKLTLESHKEFLEKLKTKYLDISESMNAVIYLDRLPSQPISGLVIKIKDNVNLSDEDRAYFEPANIKLTGVAKPIELNTEKINEKLKHIYEKLGALKNEKQLKETQIDKLDKTVSELEEELHNQEIVLANRQSVYSTVLEQFNKIKEEEDIVVLELQDVQKELKVIGENLITCQDRLNEFIKAQKQEEDLIAQEEENISGNSKIREDLLVAITQTKAELDGLKRRMVSDEATLKILEDAYKQDRENLENIENQIKETQYKEETLEIQIKDCLEKAGEFKKEVDCQNISLKEKGARYQEVSEGASDVVKKIESDRKELDNIKDKLYELQMQDKDIDYKYSSVRDRILQAYKIDLDEFLEVPENLDAQILQQEIEQLKAKLDSYGTVNLVAIEEYDELKKRYDFLVQQQNDLLSAKDSLHQAILKINRTTKQMFLETFERVREEFRNYFRLLFNGGDAQVFLIDEQDPLESGIEIICRPPGKKLQNVLLLSGGEKALSAIALIFAIFKVKPSPFCVLDEIDAALDEANVDRFSRVLQEFAKTSQFIVITHNKRTIVNADIMYGITMQESGISKIVSVKFSQDRPVKDAQPEAVAKAI